jgi:hypothetical protein
MQAEGKIILNIKKNGMIQIILAAAEAIAKTAAKIGCKFSQKALTSKGLACEIKGPLAKLKTVRKVIKPKGKLILPAYLLFETKETNQLGLLLASLRREIRKMGNFRIEFEEYDRFSQKRFSRGIVWVENSDNPEEIQQLKGLHIELTENRGWDSIPKCSVWLFIPEKTAPSLKQQKKLAA